MLIFKTFEIRPSVSRLGEFKPPLKLETIYSRWSPAFELQSASWLRPRRFRFPIQPTPPPLLPPFRLSFALFYFPHLFRSIDS